MTRWQLWFAARPTLPPAMRGHTTSGAVKPAPPTLPPSTNERRQLGYWGERKLVGYWRGEGARLAREAGIPPLGRIRVSAVIYRRALNVADEDNDRSRLKPLVDSLRDAKVIANDNRKYVDYGEVTEQHIGERGAGVLLIVERLEGEE